MGVNQPEPYIFRVTVNQNGRISSVERASNRMRLVIQIDIVHMGFKRGSICNYYIVM